jgi:hypothetical protein
VGLLGVDEQEGDLVAVFFLKLLQVPELGDTGRSGVAAELDEDVSSQVVTQVALVAVGILQMQGRRGLADGKFSHLVELSERAAAAALGAAVNGAKGNQACGYD